MPHAAAPLKVHGVDQARHTLAWWPVWLGLVLRLGVWLTIPDHRFASDEASYFQAATALLVRGEQDVYFPPATSWLLAGLRTVLATDALATIRLAWIGLDIGNLLAVRTLAGRLASSMVAAHKRERLVTLATAAYAVYLPAIAYAQFTTSETPALAMLLVALVALTRPRGTWRHAAFAGLMIGALILTRTNLLPLAIALPLAAGGLVVPDQRRRHTVAFVAATALVVSGGLGSVWYATGTITLGRNATENFALGNRAEYAEDLNLFAPRATDAQVAYRRRMLSVGTTSRLAEPTDVLLRGAVAWIAAHPGAFVRRAAGRLARVFAPRTDVLELLGGEGRAGIRSRGSLALLVAANAEWTVVLFAGLAGLAAVRRLAPALGRLLVATIAGAVLLSIVAIAKPRYSFVFDPLLMLGAAALIVGPGAAIAALRPRDRWALGLVGAFIAWGWVAWAVFAVTSRAALA